MLVGVMCGHGSVALGRGLRLAFCEIGADGSWGGTAARNPVPGMTIDLSSVSPLASRNSQPGFPALDVLPIHLDVGSPLFDLFEIGAILKTTGKKFQQDKVFQRQEWNR